MKFFLIAFIFFMVCTFSWAQTNLELRINAGSSQVTHDGETFEADQYYSGGHSWTTANLPVDDMLKTERSSGTQVFSYNIPVDNGSYQVSLYFAEIYFGASGNTSGAAGAGYRVFDVSIEGNLVLDNYDINADVGPETEVVKTFTASVTDGSLDIYFSALAADGGTNQPKLSGLVVEGLSSLDTQDPTAPTLSSTGHGQTTVDLSWSGATDNVGVTGYKVFKDGVLEATLGNVSSYQVTGLTASTSYSFTVTALDAAANESTASNAVSVTTDSSADTQDPTSPTLSSSGQGETTADLSWSGATDNVGVTGYNIYKDGVLETNTSASPYMVTGLTASTTYSFTVTALDAAANESVVSNAVSVTTDAGSGGGGSSAWSESGSTLSHTGEVAIGINTVPSGYQLAVDGKIISEELKVQLQSDWPDYVFEEDYDLPTLGEIQKYIEEKGHLPNIPSATDVEANGIKVGEMNKLLLEKIEEQMLYIFQQEKRIQLLETQIKKITNEKTE